MSTMSSITCPECNTVLRPAKPLRAGKSVKCPKCGAGFVVGGDEPAPPTSKSKAPSPVQKKPAPSVAPLVPQNDDDEDGDGQAYSVQTEAAADGPKVSYALDMSIRDLRGPAMSQVIDPSNKLIIVGVSGFIGWVAFLVTLRGSRERPGDSKQRCTGKTGVGRGHWNSSTGARDEEGR
jgi:hypothetical protein